jgi:hypothetical protein
LLLRLVKPLQGHLQERQSVAAFRIPYKDFGEGAALRVCFIYKRRMAGSHRARDDLFQLRDGGWKHVERGALVLQDRQKRFDQLKTAVGIAAQRTDHAG